MGHQMMWNRGGRRGRGGLDDDRSRGIGVAMYIQTETTPNPASLKFLPGRELIAGEGREFSAADAAASPLAQRLLALPGVDRVYIGGDFVTVSQTGQNWADLKPQVLAALMDHFLAQEPAVLSDAAGQAEATIGEDSPLAAQIRELIDTRVRPAVAQDGGDILFRGFENGIVYLQMKGACSGCPSSTATLRYGIENMLKHYVPEVTEVRPV